MEEELASALRAEYDGKEATELDERHLRFALTSRKRGRERLDRAVSHAGVSLRGARVLDVGSAYGGFVVEAASRGAEAWGVEINERLHQLALLGARGERGDMHFVHADFLSRRALAALPRDFDLVVANDVFEHVYDTARLLAQLHTVMRDGAPFVFSIPNGDAIQHVVEEGHYGLPAITQLPPNEWQRYLRSFTAFYRPWSYYTGLFRAFGFTRIETWGRALRTLDEARAEIPDGLARARARIRDLKMDGGLKQMLSRALDRYEERVTEDLAAGDLALLNFRYLTKFWNGVAFKDGRAIADLDERPPRRSLARVVARQLVRWVRR
jgi:SAM-dependent methyltransferase